ncbi:unnamed protein product [Lactuca saligna]|uniref:Uncharacterized protein n=1 Tax=Lactuca saligna TaxID=75948 RepID=A0AA36EBF6_LACSI|nr:unnamed protein product [Lactuca saligna]
MTQHPCTTKPNATYDPTQFPHQYSYYLSASPTYEPTILSTHTGPNSNKQSTPLLSQPSDAPLLHSSPASHFRRHPPTPSHLRRYPPIPPAPPSHSRCRSRCGFFSCVPFICMNNSDPEEFLGTLYIKESSMRKSISQALVFL